MNIPWERKVCYKCGYTFGKKDYVKEFEPSEIAPRYRHLKGECVKLERTGDE